MKSTHFVSSMEVKGLHFCDVDILRDELDDAFRCTKMHLDDIRPSKARYSLVQPSTKMH